LNRKTTVRGTFGAVTGSCAVWRLLLPLVILAVLVVAPTATAATPPPPLAGENLYSNETTGGTENCNADDTGTFTYHSTGDASGPYPGTYTESGTVTIGPGPAPNGSLSDPHPVTAFSATFTITSGSTIISGTKTYDPAGHVVDGAAGRCSADAEPNGIFPTSYASFNLKYTARINQEGSPSYLDGGTGYVAGFAIPDPRDSQAATQGSMYEHFTTSTGVTPETTGTPFSMGPQAMEGDLKLNPGDVLKVGYDFTMPGSHPATDVSFDDTKVTFEATCESGTGGATIAVPISPTSYTDPANSSAWYPSGDQKSASVYQGQLVVPDICAGAKVSLKRGGTFTGSVGSTNPTHKVNARWHYSANDSSGSWSGTKTLIGG
jgi:hypothetical protein